MLVASIVALPAGDIIEYIKQMVSLVMSGMAVCALLGRYWPRATWQGGLACFVGGAACSCYFMWDRDLNAFWGGSVIPSALAALAGGLIVSVATPKTSVTPAEALNEFVNERSSLESS